MGDGGMARFRRRRRKEVTLSTQTETHFSSNKYNLLVNGTEPNSSIKCLRCK
jgi:hypothetical protein